MDLLQSFSSLIAKFFCLVKIEFELCSRSIADSQFTISSKFHINNHATWMNSPYFTYCKAPKLKIYTIVFFCLKSYDLFIRIIFNSTNKFIFVNKIRLLHLIWIDKIINYKNCVNIRTGVKSYAYICPMYVHNRYIFTRRIIIYSAVLTEFSEHRHVTLHIFLHGCR